MKFVTPSALLFAALAMPAMAQTEAPAPASPAPAAKFNADTPIEVLVADPQAAAVLETHLPGTSKHPSYEMFKAMSLRQVAPYSNGMVTEEAIAKIDKDLAAIK